MNILKEIISNHGYVTNTQLATLVEEYPNLPLVIKWGCSARSIHCAKDVDNEIKNKMNSDKNEYVREVFISANQLETLRSALGLDK